MSRYYVNTPAQLILAQTALDQSFGLRDAAGNPTPRERVVHKPGMGLVPASVALGPLHSEYDLPGTHWPLIEGEDGSAAIRIAELPSVDEKLGKTISGVALPTSGALVHVLRERDHNRLPKGVSDKLDDEYADRVYAKHTASDGTLDLAAANAEITSELESTRAANAISRKGLRRTRTELDVVIGHVRS